MAVELRVELLGDVTWLGKCKPTFRRKLLSLKQREQLTQGHSHIQKKLNPVFIIWLISCITLARTGRDLEGNWWCYEVISQLISGHTNQNNYTVDDGINV
jgi:hypothetical protein